MPKTGQIWEFLDREAEPLHTLSVGVDMNSCLYSTLQLPDASLASVEVSVTLLKKIGTDRQTAVFVKLIPTRKTLKSRLVLNMLNLCLIMSISLTKFKEKQINH